MKVGNEDKRKLILAGVLGFFAIFALYYGYVSFFGGTDSPPPAPPVIVDATPRGSGGSATGPATRSGGPAATSGGAAVKLGSVRSGLDPTLHMAAMHAAESLVYSGTGRNIFAAGPSPEELVKVAQSKFPPRPVPAPAQQSMVPAGPPPPPPINLKFFGLATQDGRRRALLLSGEDVFLASVGDIVERRYRITAVSASTITVEDMPNSNKQTLPLLAN